MLKGRPEALDLLIAYCKQQDLDLLKDIYYQAAMPQESANIAVLEAYQNSVNSPAEYEHWLLFNQTVSFSLGFGQANSGTSDRP